MKVTWPREVMGGNGKEEKRICILKVDLTGFVDGLKVDMREREGVKDFDLSKILEYWSCHVLIWQILGWVTFMGKKEDEMRGLVFRYRLHPGHEGLWGMFLWDPAYISHLIFKMYVI